MTKYMGAEVEVRMSTDLPSLTTVSAIGNIQSVTFKVDQAIKLHPTGLGSRASLAKEGQEQITGTITRDYDEVAVIGSTTFAEISNTFETYLLTRHTLEIKNKTTGKKWQFTNVVGSYNPNLGSPDGLVVEKFDFVAETIIETT